MAKAAVRAYLRLSGLLRRLRNFLWVLDLRLRGVTVGKRLVVHGPVHVRGGERITIGDDVTLYDHVYLNAFRDGRLTIGNGCSINRMTIINASEQVTLGDRVHIGPMCFITDKDHVTELGSSGRGETAPVVLEGPGGVGQGCTILHGVRLGPRVFVAAGAVVNKSFPGYVVIGGVPARVLRERTEYTHVRQELAGAGQAGHFQERE